MGMFERIFGKREPPAALKTASVFKLLEGYTPSFTTWRGSIYESELIRACLDAWGRHAAKMKINIKGKAQTDFTGRLKIKPNRFQAWSQFLYQTVTVLLARNTAFLVKTLDGRDGSPTGIMNIIPERWELVEYQGEPYIRFFLSNNRRAAVELAQVGILTRYQYKSELFGENNTAMKPTLDLIEMQRQGITEGIKNGASYRFSAQSDNWATDEDLAKEMERFNRFTFGNKKSSGGMILFPNTYKDIKQLVQEAYKVDAEQQKLIKDNVFDYFATNEKILQNQAIGDEWLAFYEGAIEWFAIQLSEAMTGMIYTEREQAFDNEVFFSSNRLQYMNNKDKLEAIKTNADRGLMTRNELREIENLPPLPEPYGSQIPARGEYYDIANPPKDKTGGGKKEPEEPAEGQNGGNEDAGKSE